MQTNSVKTGENRLQSIKYFDLIFSNRIYSKKKKFGRRRIRQKINTQFCSPKTSTYAEKNYDCSFTVC